MSVTAGNWLSQHGGRSSTGGETVLPRQNRLFPVWCLPCAVKLPTRVAGGASTQPELRRLLPRPPSRTQRAAGGVEFFLDLGSAADAAAATLGNNDTFHSKLSRQRLLAARRGGLARAPRDRSVDRRTCSVGSAEDTASQCCNSEHNQHDPWQAVSAAPSRVARRSARRARARTTRSLGRPPRVRQLGT